MKMIYRTSLATLLLIVGFVNCGWAEQPTRLPINDAELNKLLETEYYGVYMQGKKVGWVRDETSLSGGADPTYVFKSELTMRILIAGAAMERRCYSVVEFDGKSPYAFRGGINRMADGKIESEIVVHRVPQGFEAVVSNDGKKFRKAFAAPNYTLADRVATVTWLRQGAKPGESIVTRGFNFDDLRVELTRNRLTDQKDTLVRGQKVPCQAVETCKVDDKFPGLECYDPRNQKTLLAILPGLMEIRAEDEKVATIIESGPDLFVNTKIKTDRTLGESTSIAGLEIETVGAHDLLLVDQPGQEVARTPVGEYILKLGRLGPASIKAEPRDIAEALKETTSCPLSDPKIRELARQAVGNAKMPKEKVERLVHFVARYINYDISANPMTVEQLIATRKGKCGDFAGLFALLARSEGIPTRVVSGFYYLGDRERAFAGHAWNDVDLDGRWIAVDPTLDEVELDGAHIHLEESPFAASSHGLAKLKVRKIEYAKQQYLSKQGTFALQVPQGTWRKTTQPLNPVAEVAYAHKSGDAFAMIIAEQHYVPLFHTPQNLKLSDLRKAFLDNIRSFDPKAKIIREESKKIQGQDALTIVLEVETQGQSLTYEVLLYSANATSIQIFTWTTRPRYAELQPDLEAFLSALEILKGTKKE